MDGLREGRLDRRMDKYMDRWENGRTRRLNFLHSRCQQIEMRCAAKIEVDIHKRLEGKGTFSFFLFLEENICNFCSRYKFVSIFSLNHL